MLGFKLDTKNKKQVLSYKEEIMADRSFHRRKLDLGKDKSLSRRVTDQQKEAILVRDGRRCVYCGYYASEVDHVIPVTKGGIDSSNNLVACCFVCNHRKSNKLNMLMITRGLLWLSTHGENTDWVDRISF